MPLLGKYTKFASVDDKFAASERMRAVDPSAGSVYARSTVHADTAVAEAAAEAAAAAPAPRKLTRLRREASPATPAVGDPADE